MPQQRDYTKPIEQDPQWVKEWYNDYGFMPKTYVKKAVAEEKGQSSLISEQLLQESRQLDIEKKEAEAKERKEANKPIKAYAVRDPITGVVQPDSLKFEEGSSQYNEYLMGRAKGLYSTEDEQTRAAVKKTQAVERAKLDIEKEEEKAKTSKKMTPQEKIDKYTGEIDNLMKIMKTLEIMPGKSRDQDASDLIQSQLNAYKELLSISIEDVQKDKLKIGRKQVLDKIKKGATKQEIQFFIQKEYGITVEEFMKRTQ